MTCRKCIPPMGFANGFSILCPHLVLSRSVQQQRYRRRRKGEAMHRCVGSKEALLVAGIWYSTYAVVLGMTETRLDLVSGIIDSYQATFHNRTRILPPGLTFSPTLTPLLRLPTTLLKVVAFPVPSLNLSRPNPPVLVTEPVPPPITLPLPLPIPKTMTLPGLPALPALPAL